MNVPAKPLTRNRDPQRGTTDRDERSGDFTDVVCLGEALWDLRVPEGATLEATARLELEPGGGAVNVAAHLVRLGAKAALVAAVGADPVGRALVARLARMGIDVSRVREAAPRTGLVILTRAPTRAVSYRSPKEEGIALAGALPKAFDATIVHVSGLLPSRAATAALVSATKRARREGCVVSIDVNLRPRLWPGDAIARVGLHRVLAEADVLKVSEDDLRVLGAKDARDLQRSLRPSAIVVSTHGGAEARAIGPFGELAVARHRARDRERDRRGRRVRRRHALGARARGGRGRALARGDRARDEARRRGRAGVARARDLRLGLCPKPQEGFYPSTPLGSVTPDPYFVLPCGQHKQKGQGALPLVGSRAEALVG